MDWETGDSNAFYIFITSGNHKFYHIITYQSPDDDLMFADQINIQRYPVFIEQNHLHTCQIAVSSS